jgi:hypothetical protein
MNRASPVELRKGIEAANAMVKAGIRFIPIPALDDADYQALTNQLMDRMEQIAQQAEKVQP